MSEADFDESVLLDESGAEDTLEERIHFFLIVKLRNGHNCLPIKN